MAHVGAGDIVESDEREVDSGEEVGVGAAAVVVAVGRGGGHGSGDWEIARVGWLDLFDLGIWLRLGGKIGGFGFRHAPYFLA